MEILLGRRTDSGDNHGVHVERHLRWVPQPNEVKSLPLSFGFSLQYSLTDEVDFKIEELPSLLTVPPSVKVRYLGGRDPYFALLLDDDHIKIYIFAT
ncbi:hypothetical protein QJS04_geneDACA003348 [Acorus gramineus]|uniref:Uncharacterized protein n=1 Tax=Acorus gramineus TaxID=55184 RepID=A0AAV9BRC0_ACOGR|nr:hypothetical protein QJS04_geneDACA003348 [Acorus gramineus]